MMQKKPSNNRFSQDWKYGSENDNVILFNEKIDTKIYRYHIVDDDKFLYECIGINENINNALAILIDENGSVGLIYEWRPIPNKFFWSCVRGFGEKSDNDYHATIKREILEETGLEIVKSKYECSIYQNTSFYENPINIFRVFVKNRNQKLEKEEGIIKLKFFKREEIVNMIKNREITCQMTLSALALYLVE
jgi:ADP-ribose pyrophosphatase